MANRRYDFDSDFKLAEDLAFDVESGYARAFRDETADASMARSVEALEDGEAINWSFTSGATTVSYQDRVDTALRAWEFDKKWEPAYREEEDLFWEAEHDYDTIRTLDLLENNNADVRRFALKLEPRYMDDFTFLIESQDRLGSLPLEYAWNMDCLRLFLAFDYDQISARNTIMNLDFDMPKAWTRLNFLRATGINSIAELLEVKALADHQGVNLQGYLDQRSETRTQVLRATEPLPPAPSFRDQFDFDTSDTEKPHASEVLKPRGRERFTNDKKRFTPSVEAIATGEKQGPKQLFMPDQITEQRDAVAAAHHSIAHAEQRLERFIQDKKSGELKDFWGNPRRPYEDEQLHREADIIIARREAKAVRGRLRFMLTRQAPKPQSEKEDKHHSQPKFRPTPAQH